MFDESTTLANAERAPDERPSRVAPTIPDEETGGAPFVGSVSGELRHWRERALRAERIVRSLGSQLSGWSFRP